MFVVHLEGYRCPERSKVRQQFWPTSALFCEHNAEASVVICNGPLPERGSRHNPQWAIIVKPIAKSILFAQKLGSVSEPVQPGQDPLEKPFLSCACES